MPHHVLEGEAHEAPRQVVERRGGRDGAGAAEDERGHEVAQRGGRAALGEEVDYEWGDGAEEEEAEEGEVDLAWGEDAGRAD